MARRCFLFLPHQTPPLTFPILPACYIAVDQKVDVRGALSKIGLLSSKAYDDAAATDPTTTHQSWMEKLLSGGSSTIALAFICNKALFPVRTPITLALTPAVARYVCCLILIDLI